MSIWTRTWKTATRAKVALNDRVKTGFTVDSFYRPLQNTITLRSFVLSFPNSFNYCVYCFWSFDFNLITITLKQVFTLKYNDLHYGDFHFVPI